MLSIIDFIDCPRRDTGNNKNIQTCYVYRCDVGNLENMECRNAGMPESLESRNPRNNYKNYELKSKLIK